MVKPISKEEQEQCHTDQYPLATTGHAKVSIIAPHRLGAHYYALALVDNALSDSLESSYVVSLFDADSGALTMVMRRQPNPEVGLLE